MRRGDAEEARISYRTRHREKAEIWIELNLRVTRKVDGEIDGVVAISRDITEQKGLEERLETLAVEDGLTVSRTAAASTSDCRRNGREPFGTTSRLHC